MASTGQAQALRQAEGSRPTELQVDGARLEGLVAASIAARPNALAVAAPDGEWSYAELDRVADDLAGQLRELGATTGSLVALCLGRSAAQVAAALAVLRTGATYLPLDATSPDRRLHELLAQSGAQIVISESEIRGLSTATSTDCAGLAYVCYTSGSTGRPKGVMVEHDGLVNLIRWHNSTFDVGPADRCTQIASPAFDAFAWELWSCLAAGASLHIPPEELKTDPQRLSDWLIEEQISVTFLPTPLAEAVLQLDWPASTSLRYLLTGGDRLHQTPRPGLPFTVVNNYGVTEGSVVSTSGAVRPSVEASSPTIGQPIDGVMIRVVDGDLTPVSDGELGELLIGGVSVARGYLDAPDLTRERFITDLEQEEGAARWYRTGDRVRRRADGELEYLGRLDDQVQIRGQRVEPGEIAAALLTHPRVAKAVVVGREDVSGEQVLVAYVVGGDAEQADARELRRHVAELLPVQYLPAAFVWLTEMPTMPNGKVDRAALPVPDPSAFADNPLSRPPVGELEVTIASIIAELLGVESVGADEHFILLGGHSLMAAQLMVRLADRFGVELALRTIFEHPTVAEIAEEVLRLLVLDVSQSNAV